MAVEKCALYDDLKALYKKTVPAVQQIEDKMHLFSKEHIQTKACKTEIIRLENIMRAFA
jgi:predicted DNA-binding protein YlxM (UPF0122 family)